MQARDVTADGSKNKGLIRSTRREWGEAKEEEPRDNLPTMPPNSSSDSNEQDARFFKLYAFADTQDALLMIVGGAGALIAGTPLPLAAYFFGICVTSLTHPSQQPHSMSQTALRCTVAGCIAAVGYFFQVACWMAVGERQAYRIRCTYMEALLRQDPSFFDVEISTGAAVESMAGEAHLIKQASGEKVGSLLQTLGTLLTGYTIAFLQGWKLTLLVTALLVPFIGVVGFLMDRRVSRTSREALEANSGAGSIVEQVMSAIRTVAAFNGERRALQAYDGALKAARKAGVEERVASGVGMGAVGFATYTVYAFTMWYGAQLIAHDGRYDGSKVISVLFCVVIATGSLGQSATSLTAIASGTAAAHKMFEVIAWVPAVDVAADGGVELPDLCGRVSLEHLRFAYPSRPSDHIFTDLSLTVPAGATAALVGESGCGKSTVVSLIERFYDPQGGRILIDGVPLPQLKLSWLRRCVGLVAQEPVLFQGTVRDNVAYGRPWDAQPPSDAEVEAALHLAHANFVATLPQGLDTPVGGGGGGVQLSGGQKQRIAIARALLKDPRILLLDEATSSLDTASETLVHAALEQIMHNRTTLIVAHRLTTVKNAHFIAVLQGGVVAEKGSYAELAKTPNGLFAQLVSLQERVRADIEHDVRDSASSTSDSNEEQEMVSLTFNAAHRRSVPSHNSIGTCNDTMGSHDYRAQTTDTSPPVRRSHILRLATYNKPELPFLLLGSIAAGINGAVLPIVGLLFATIIKTFYKPPALVRSATMPWIHLFLILACISLLLTPLQSLCFSIAGERLVRRLRLLTFGRVLDQEMLWFDDPANASGVISSRLLRDASQMRTVVGDALSLFVQNGVTVSIGLFIAMSTCWQLALLFIALLPFYCLDGAMQIKLGEVFDAEARAMYEESSQVAHEAFSSIRTVASFCAEKKISAVYRAKSSKCVKAGVRRGIIGGFGMGLTYVFMFGSLSLSFWAGGKLIDNHTVDLDGFLKTFLSIELSAFAVALSVALAPDFSNAKPAMVSIFDMLDLEPRNPSGMELKSLEGSVEFKHVRFTYPTRPSTPIFHDLCFKLSAGKTLALVGESGGGKSTVLALLQRFYKPSGGKILVDRVDAEQLEVKWLRRQMGMVGQEPVLFNESIRYNIAYGMAEASEEEVARAAEAAHAHKFISALPEGYASVVGERGVQLSGGQKQRVAIARAIVRDPRILLLDEATSALDAEAELVVQEALETAAAGRSALVVAHRLSTVRRAHVIAVLKDGAIAEQGTHDELLKLSRGLYAALLKHSLPSNHPHTVVPAAGMPLD